MCGQLLIMNLTRYVLIVVLELEVSSYRAAAHCDLLGSFETVLVVSSH